MDSGTQTMAAPEQTPSSERSGASLKPVRQMPFRPVARQGIAQSQRQHAEMLEFLSCPESYGLTTPVDRLDAGDATLFLAGHFCYKFLHHGSPDKQAAPTRQERFRLMRQEMQLGRLFAPDVYRGLIPIVACDGQFRLLLAGDKSQKSQAMDKMRIVDWLICMNRYDLTESYDKLVEHHQPNHAECNHLAAMVLPGAGETTPAKAQPWLSWLDGQLDGLDEFVLNLESSKERCQSHACLTRAKDRLAQLSGLMAERGERGCMRPIHGNLNLSNVVCLPSGLCSVNPDAGRLDKGMGDPVFDLACLISELWSRNLHRQANWLLSHYCNQLLDSRAMDGLGALDLYLCYAALERAKTLAEHRSDNMTAAIEPPRQCGHSIATDRYLRTARESLLQDQAYLVVLGGGKAIDRSRLARLLAPSLGRMPGAIHLSSEREMLTMHDVVRAEDLPAPSHRQSVWSHVYRRLCAKAKLALEAGYSVVLDGNFCNETGRLNLERLLTHYGLENQIHSHAFWLYQPRHEQISDAEMTKDLEWLAMQATGGRQSSALQLNNMPRGLEDWTSLDASQPSSRLLDQMLAAVIPFWRPVAKGPVH